MTCPAARKQANPHFNRKPSVTVRLAFSSSLPSMLKASAFLRDISTGRAGGFREQGKRVRSAKEAERTLERNTKIGFI